MHKTHLQNLSVNTFFHVFKTTTNLDPCKEDHDGESRVEDHLPVTEALEVAVLIGVGQELLEDVVDLHRAVEVERDAANGHQNDDDVQDVPERLKIGQLQILDLFLCNKQQRKLHCTARTVASNTI